MRPRGRAFGQSGLAVAALGAAVFLLIGFWRPGAEVVARPCVVREGVNVDQEDQGWKGFDAERTICTHSLVENTSVVAEHIRARHKWATDVGPYLLLNTELNNNLGKPKSKGRNSTRFPQYRYATEWSGMQYDHKRFDFMGPVSQMCPLERRKEFGAYFSATRNAMNVDEMKKICMTEDLQKPGCSIFSIGSNNQWHFELDIARATPCDLFVFDCTLDVKIPVSIASRVKFFKVCLADSSFVDQHGREFRDWKGLHALAGVSAASFMKMDIEGWEWPVLSKIIDSASAHYSATGEDIFPQQIALELHYLTQMNIDWHGRDKSPGEIFAFFNFLFYRGGYLLADRRDNEMCRHCSEILMIRALC